MVWRIAKVNSYNDTPKLYLVTGGMQDYNYIFHGTMEITLEVSCCKHPMASTLRQHWLDNRKVIYYAECQPYRIREYNELDIHFCQRQSQQTNTDGVKILSYST
jgi:hypothetical protein